MKLKREEMVTVLKKRLDELIKISQVTFFTDYEGIIKGIDEAWLEVKNDVKEKSKDLKKQLAALRKNAKSRNAKSRVVGCQ